MRMKVFNIFSITWNEISTLARSIVPPLLQNEYKGSMGRMGFVGGSKDYTGAIYYSSESSLRFGGDLAFVFCSKEASTPIKCYSPELMVTPFYNDDLMNSLKHSNVEIEMEIERASNIVKDTLPRIHTLVVGPGLGRDPNVMKSVEEIIIAAKTKNMPLIIDADGLWLLTNNLSVLHGYHRCILTPNQMELTRLIDATKHFVQQRMDEQEGESTSTEAALSIYRSLLTELQSEDEYMTLRAVSLALGGLTILRKGESDMITSGGDVYVLNEKGSPRRCGGQGDLLAGCLSVAYYWSEKLKLQNMDTLSIADHLQAHTATATEAQSALDIEELHSVFPEIQPSQRQFLSKGITSMHGGSVKQLGTSSVTMPSDAGRSRQGAELACLLAATVVKKASELAFAQSKRSTTSPLIMDKIGEAFESVVNTQ